VKMSTKRSNDSSKKRDKDKHKDKRKKEDSEEESDEDDKHRRHTKTPTKDKSDRRRRKHEDDEEGSGKKERKVEAETKGVVNILIVFYSTYGHIYTLAKAAKQAAEKAGANVRLRRVAETLPVTVLEKMNALEAQKQFEDVTLAAPSDVEWADGILWGTPTRFGNVTGQMKSFMDSLGQIWAKNLCVGKVASAFTSSATMHGGQEMTIVAGFYPFFCHLGFVIAGLPYSFKGLNDINDPNGCSPYGTSTVAGPDGSRIPDQLELDGMMFQAERVVKMSSKLSSKPTKA